MASRIAQTAVVVFLVSIVGAQLTAPPGPKGFKGDPGPTGATGATGPPGAPGVAGDKGEKGSIGIKGSQGQNGTQGATGYMGPPGEAGVQGNTGSIGNNGSTGESGMVGEIGGTGATGLTGATGEQGPKGDKGTIGNVGPQGNSGEPGDAGELGSVGIIGLSGQKGDRGDVGPRGWTMKDIDIDECADAMTNNCDPVSTLCINWATGFRCQCKPGYQAMNGSVNACEDINECDTNNGDCAGVCTNTMGSYSCSCPPSTTSLTENNQCADLNECTTSPCGSSPDVYCINKYNGYVCAFINAPQDATTAAGGVAQALTTAMSSNNIIIVLLAWFSILTFIGIVILIWLIYVFYKMKREKAEAEYDDRMYSPTGEMEEEYFEDLSMPEGMASQSSMQIDVARPPRSLRGTWKGTPKGSLKGKKSYKAGKSSRPGSVSSGTGAELRTASVTQHRVAAGERSSANRLRGVDTFY